MTINALFIRVTALFGLMIAGTQTTDVVNFSTIDGQMSKSLAF
jgi:hypothetical protein